MKLRRVPYRRVRAMTSVSARRTVRSPPLAPLGLGGDQRRRTVGRGLVAGGVARGADRDDLELAQAPGNRRAAPGCLNTHDHGAARLDAERAAAQLQDASARSDLL